MSEEGSEHRAGRCSCGAVAFFVYGTPNGATNCHCRQCQSASGAPYVTWVEFPANQVSWEGPEPTWYASSPTAERGFCPHCGSTIAFRYTQGNDIDLAVVLFDDPEAFPPDDELWTASRRRWTRLDPNLPHYVGERDRK